jgi:hypothetical protein
VIEALVSTVLLLIGIVLASPSLRPIEWAAWAGEAEKDTRRPKGQKRFEGDGGAEGVGVSWLDDRKGFVDIRVCSSSGPRWFGEMLTKVIDTEAGVCGLDEKRRKIEMSIWYPSQ